jgi:hypothetical protein
VNSELVPEVWDEIADPSRQSEQHPLLEPEGPPFQAVPLELIGDEAAPLEREDEGSFPEIPGSHGPQQGQLATRPLSSFAIRRVEWLDKPFLQRSAFHLFAGRKGVCKGTYLAGLASRVTNGELYGEPKRVLVVTSEDSVELDFKPRVLAAGGEPSLVEIVTGMFLMPRDIAWLEQTAQRLADVGLIIVDPIGNHLGGSDTDKEGLVRNAIAPLNQLADELDCLIAGVRHLNKDSKNGALASVLGSTAWVDVPRAVIVMAADDEDDMVFHAQVVAGNRGPKNSGRAFRLELVDVPPAVEINYLVPTGASSKDVEDLLARRAPGELGEATRSSRSSAARELILDILEGEGEQDSDALDARVAAETGLKAQTIRNQRAALKNAGLIKVYPEKDEFGAVERWKLGRTHAPRELATVTGDPVTGSEGAGEDSARPSQKPSSNRGEIETVTGQPSNRVTVSPRASGDLDWR